MEYKNMMDWRGGPGICRCCLSEGCYKDISSEYFWMGEKEVYAEMLKQCFDLEISVHEGIPKGTSRLICEVCITRLRDASNFKNQVVRCEKQFVEFINQTGRVMEGVDALTAAEEGVKMESDVKREAGEVSDEEFLDNTIFFDDEDSSDDKPVSALKLEKEAEEAGGEVVKKKKVKSAKRKSSSKSAEPSVKKSKIAKAPKVAAGASTSKPKRGHHETNKRELIQVDIDVGVCPKSGFPPKKISSEPKENKVTAEVRVQQLMTKKNAKIIIENTTVCPFKWYQNYFYCPYCDEKFYKSLEMRLHHIENHGNENADLIYKKMRQFDFIYIDITNSKCSQCYIDFESFHHLKSHITDEHGFDFETDYDDGVVPFVLGNDDWACALCAMVFPFFLTLCEHMNSHYRNFICDICGKGFLTWPRLRNHRQLHAEGEFQCNSCSVSFSSRIQRDRHTRQVHAPKLRYLCAICETRFASYDERLNHNLMYHDLKPPQYTCPHCHHIFLSKWSRRKHIQQEHVPREKKFGCELCPLKFFSNYDLKLHYTKHTGEKNFHCPVCKKSYTCSSSLRLHMRTHTNDRRFKCSVCELAFIQKHSMLSHMKTHHPEALPNK